jgi:16S rRNA (uracil1498-N3)-methyltransferase
MGDDLHHIKNVLRLKPDEKIHICNDSGTKFEATLKSYEGDKGVFELTKEIGSSESCVDITLFQGLPKSDKMDYIIQKTTELGVNSIIPVNMQFSIAKVDRNNANKLARWNKIAKEAASQSGRNIIPSVLEPINFENIIENIEKYDIVLLPYENEKLCTMKEAIRGQNYKKVAIIIGPEGGFSKVEVDLLAKHKNVKIITLGSRILRTETAGIATMAMLSYEYEL